MNQTTHIGEEVVLGAIEIVAHAVSPHETHVISSGLETIVSVVLKIAFYSTYKCKHTYLNVKSSILSEV